MAETFAKQCSMKPTGNLFKTFSLKSLVFLVLLAFTSTSVSALYNQSSTHYVSFEESFLSEYLTNSTLVLTNITSISVTEKNQTWMDFDGVTNSINVTDSNSLKAKEAVTVSMWVNPKDLSAANQMLLRKGTASVSYQLYTGHDRVLARFNYDGAPNYLTIGTSTQNLTTNEWQNIVINYDSQGDNRKGDIDNFTYSKPINGLDSNSILIPSGDAEDYDDHIREIGNVVTSPPTDKIYLDDSKSSVLNFGDSPNLSFGNGTDDFPVSFSMWVYPLSFAQYGSLLGKYENPYEYYLQVHETDGQLVPNFRDNSGADNIYRTSGAGFLQIGKWNYVVVTYDGSKSADGIHTYLDGVLTDGTATTGGGYVAMENTNAPFVVGRRSTAAYSFNGSIDELRVYNRTLSLAEVQNINASGRVYNESLVPTGLIFYLPMDEGIGVTTTKDTKLYLSAPISDMSWSDYSEKYTMTYSTYNGTYDQFDNCSWASSYNGLNWTKRGVMIPDRYLEDSYVVIFKGTYFMYAEDKSDVPFRNIRCYNSTDLDTWYDMGDCLDIGSAGSWEDSDVSSPAVWNEDDTTLYMLYEGRCSSGTYCGGQVGLATSTDGINWVKSSANPILNGSVGATVPWHTQYAVPDDIYKKDDKWYMTYHGYGAGYGFYAGQATTYNLTNSSWVRDKEPLTHRDTAMYFWNGSEMLFTYAAYSEDIVVAYPWIINQTHIYRNGIEETFYSPYEQLYGKNLTTVPTDLGIGMALSGTRYPFNGSFDEIRVYNSSLTAQEILEIYNNGRKQNTSVLTTGNNSNQVLYMPFNENQGIVTYEQSGQSNNGTVSGATWKDDGLNVSLVEDTDYTLHEALGKIELLAEEHSRILLTASYNSTTEILNNTKSTDSTFRIYNLTGALVYNQNGSIYGEQNLSANTGGLNITLPSGNLTYVLNNFNLSEGVNRSNSPLAVLSKTTVTAADGTSTVTYLLNSTLLDAINQTDFYASTTCLASGDTAVFTHSGVQTTPNDRCVSTGNVLFTLDNFGNGTNTLTINYNTATYSESIVTTPRGGSTLMDINIGDVQGGGGHSSNLKYGYRLKFSVNNISHQIKIKTTFFSEKKVIFEISSKKQDITLSEGESKEVDLDFDGMPDIVLLLEKIISGKESKIVIALPEEPVKGEEIESLVGRDAETIEDKPVGYNLFSIWTILLFVVVLLVVIVVLIVLKTQNRSNSWKKTVYK